MKVVSFKGGAAVKQIQKALAALYYYPDKGAANNGIDGLTDRRQQMRSTIPVHVQPD